MINYLNKFRWIFLIAAFFTFLNALLAILLGVYWAVEAYVSVYNLVVFHADVRPGVYVLESLDLFLVSFVLFNFSSGIARMVQHASPHEEEDQINVSRLKNLKTVMWETILLTLVVFSLTIVIRYENDLNPTVLLIPAVVLILTIALWFMKKSH
jgi:hypothetical protein